MKSLMKKMVGLLIALLLMSQAFAVGEGVLGEATSAVRDGDTVQTTTVSADGAVVEQSVVSGYSQNRAEAAQAVLGASSGTMDFVTRLYTVVLGRDPDAGYQTWVDALNNGTLSGAEVISGFFGSQEYKGKGKTNAEIVTDCYNGMLGRGADPEGMATWTARLDIGMTADAILKGFVNSNEFINLAASYGINPGDITLVNARDKNYTRTYFVYRLYENGLGRDPDPEGQESWCRALENNATGVDCASGFLFSSELKGKHLDNEEFVVVLYETVLGRGPEEAEVSAWANALNYTNTREYVFNGFLFSEEFKRQCAEIQAAVGNPLATVDESEAWQFNIQVLDLCNQTRREYGLQDLHTRQDLWQDVALVRASEIDTVFSHNRPDGRTCFTALDDAGITDWEYAGENIAYGYYTAESVFRAWMNSEGHRDNILDADYKDLATGYVYGNREDWAQMFYTPFVDD